MYSLVLMAMLGTADTAPAAHGCNGGYACNGGCNGYACNGCNGCFGGFMRRRHGCNGGCNGCSGGYACTGGSGCHGGRGCNGGTAPPPPPDGDLKKKPEALKAPAAASAYLTVSLPADAKLFINDQLTTSTSSERRFVSPPLDRGQAHRYNLRAEMMRDGQPLTVTRDVIVRGGEETRVRLDFPAGSVAQR